MQQKVDYIQHHKNVNFKMAEDDLSVIDIAIYNALFLIWNHSFFETELSINRNDVMKFAKVGNANTYTKSLKRLHEKKYIIYLPSYNPVIGSKITMCIYDKGGDKCTDKGGVISSGKAGGNGGDTLYKHIYIQTNKQLKQLDTFFKKITEDEKVKFWDYIEKNINQEQQFEKIDFSFVWDLYDKKKGDRDKLKIKWDKLSFSIQQLIIEHIPKYKKEQPEKQFRKNFETYLNNKSYNDEIIQNNGKNNGLAADRDDDSIFDKPSDYLHSN